MFVALAVAVHGQSGEEARIRWSSYVGGTDSDHVLSIRNDDFGHVYAAGRGSDSLLLGNDTTGQSGVSYQRHFGGGASDAFLAKYLPQGSMLWCTYFGGPGDDEAVQVVPVGDEGVYLVGTTTSADSMVTDTLAWQHTIGGGSDIFVAYFAGHGELVAATYFGGPGNEVATSASLDSHGRLVICGYADLDGAFPDSLPPVRNYTSGMEGLIARFTDPHQLLSGTYFGGPGDDRFEQVVQGDTTSVFLAGNTTSAAGIASSDAMTPILQGMSDAFVVRLDTGLAVLHATYFGGEADDVVHGLAQWDGRLALAGATTSAQLYTDSTAFHPQNAGGTDGFLAVLDTSLHVQWSTFIGDTAYDALMALDVDDLGRWYASGTTGSAANIATVMDSVTLLSGPLDVFVLRMDNDTMQAWSMYVGAMDAEEAHALSVMGRTSVYAGGRTSSINGWSYRGHQMNFGGGAWDGMTCRLDQRLSTAGAGICLGSGAGGGGGSGAGGGVDGSSPPQDQFDVCFGETVTFVVYGGALGYDAEWVWYRDSCGVPTQFITLGDSLTFVATENFTLYVRAEGTDHVTGCSHTHIVVHPIPDPEAWVSDTVCAGSPVVLQAMGAQYYTWVVADTVAATGPDTLFTASVLPGWQHVMLVGASGPGCTTGILDSVYVLPTPEAEWQVTSIGCQGEPGVIALTVPDSALIDPAQVTLTWQPADLEGPVLTGLGAGTYIATLTDTLTGCNRTDTLQVITPATLDLTWQVTPITCTGDPGAIHAVMNDTLAFDSTLTFQWSQPGLSGSYVEDLNPGLYIVTASDTMGCFRTDSILLALPPIALTTWLVESSTCAGSSDGSITLELPDTTLSDTAFLDIAWAVPGLNGPAVNDLPAGTYVVTITDTLGCTRTDSLSVPAPPPLMDSVSTTYAYCDAASGTAQVMTTSTAPGLVFNFGNGPDSTGYAGYLMPGAFTVTATDSAGCAQELTFMIESFGNITASIGADTLWAGNGAITLSCTLIPPDPLASFLWDPGEGLDTPDSASTTCTVQDTTTYVVHATSGAGCSSYDTVVVVPLIRPDTLPTLGQGCGDFFLPDVFSPNGDGLNEVLCPLGGCITQLEWSIHDRWGQCVFHASAPDACWDGSRSGTALPAGSYLFSFHAERSTGERIERAGVITLRR